MQELFDMCLSRSASTEVQCNIVNAVGINNYKLIPERMLRVATMVTDGVTKLQVKTQ